MRTGGPHGYHGAFRGYGGSVRDSGIKVDKHSTGALAIKTTLIAAPDRAGSLQGPGIVKCPVEGLGHTGGTVDKLEAIPGYQTSDERTRFTEIVKTPCDSSVIGQSEDLAPADKNLPLRDVTATVEKHTPDSCIDHEPKKLAAGSDCILLDVKVGSGAFMKGSAEDANRPLRRECRRSVKRQAEGVTALILDHKGTCLWGTA